MTSQGPAKIIPGESDLVARARQGDSDAYRLLVESCQDRVFGMALSMVRNREQAEDLAQEIFVKAYFALSSFKGDSAFFTWLYRIASNTCLDFLRKHRLPEVSLDQAPDADESPSRVSTIAAPASEQPEAPLEREGEVVRLLQTLSPDHRLILTLREAEGYSYDEMGEILRCSVNTVKSRLNRARVALQTAYRQKFGGNISKLKLVKNTEE